MAGNTRAELASSSLDGSNFASRYPNFDRSGSFRENLESRMMVSGPVVSRNASASVEILPVSQHMSLEPFSTNELKNARIGELRRVLGISVEDHSFGSLQTKSLPPISWEELKRFRGSVEETSLRARDRAKSLQDSMSKLDKYCNIVSKKRQRNEILSNEKSSNLNLLKPGSHMHQNPSDIAGQSLGERTKNGVPNKRIRSSMVEGRAPSPYSLQLEGRNILPSRQGTMLDKDKQMLLDKDKITLRACHGIPTPADDKTHGLPAGGDGWEKKMKKKRSIGNNRTTNGDRELKQAMQQRPNNEPRPRSGDGLGFRTGSSNGIVGNCKMDSSSQLSGGSSRIVPRTDLGNGSLPNDRRERSGLDKDRVIAKASNKLTICEDAQLGNQSPSPKVKSARGPRTGSGVAMTMPNFPRSSGSIDGWEQPIYLNRAQPLNGASNRKRPLPTGYSSPPVTKWGGQRREKISRTRRANVVSPVSNLDEAQAEGFAGPSDLGANGVLFSKGIIPNNSHPKLKFESVPSPAGLSESEESGALGNKPREKGIDNGEIENGTLNGAAYKSANFVLPSKKNKIPPREEIGDGVRRQSRSGRGSVQSKACFQTNKEKAESLETAKPFKTGKLLPDKTESKVGRPPSKKASDRKNSSRPVQIINSGSSDFAGESDDDHEDLLAAAKAVRKAGCLTCSKYYYSSSSNSSSKQQQANAPTSSKEPVSFWEMMKPIFSSVNSEDLAMVKQQINFAEELDGVYSNVLDADYHPMAEDTYHEMPSHIPQQVSQIDEPQPAKVAPGNRETKRLFDKMIPLSQRLLSAIISEERDDAIDTNTKQGDTFSQFFSDCSPNGINNYVENERGSDITKSGLEFDNDLGSQTNCYGDNTPCNGFASPSATFRSPNNFISGDELLQENDDMIHSDNPHIAALSELHKDKSQESTSTGLSGTSPYQCEFEQLSLDDRILMELNSIGIYPDAVPYLAEGDDNKIDKEISELKLTLYQQVGKKKSLLCKLEKATEEQKEYEMKNLESLAMKQLLVMAYDKLQYGRGSHGSNKSGAIRVPKPVAMAFAKRTLARYRKFEETGESCFNELTLRNVLFSEPATDSDAKIANGISSGLVPCMHVESQNCQLGSRVAASGVTSNIIERHGPVFKTDKNQFDPYQGVNHSSEQTFVRNDPISNRVKKKEVLLDDVPGGAKWKKNDKDQNRGTLAKNPAPKGERKTKSKPKQKIAQLSTSGNGLTRLTETTKVNTEVELAGSSKEMEDNIFTSLPLQGIDSIDELDVADGLGGQGQDIGSWLNVDDDALQDNDLVGLEIPMDDLSDLNMNF